MEAKEILAFEVTEIVHGEMEAEKAKESSKALFAKGGEDLSCVPATAIGMGEEGIMILDLLICSDLVSSKSEGSRLIKQGGISINGKKIDSVKTVIKKDSFKNGTLLLCKGKKQHKKLEMK